MNDPSSYRRERIERLLDELRYEVTRGVMEREIPESMAFTFAVPRSYTDPDNIVLCEYVMRAAPRWCAPPADPYGPRLRVVK